MADEWVATRTNATPYEQMVAEKTSGVKWEDMDQSMREYTINSYRDSVNNDSITGAGKIDTYKEQKSESTEDKEQPGEETADEDALPGQKGSGDKVDLATHLFGLPPIFNDDPVTGSLVKNSFPILKITPIKVVRPEKSQSIDPKQNEPLGEPYKFIIKNEGGITYNLQNQYGESNIENFMKSFQFDDIADLHQLAKNSRFLNYNMQTGKDILQAGADTALGRGLAEIGKGMKTHVSKVWDEIAKNAFITGEMGENAKRVLNSIKTVGNKAVDLMLMGRKVDIPNVWKGSGSNISQTVNITLHCLDPRNDDTYYEDIVLPLKILLRLSAPYSKTEKAGGEESGGAENQEDEDDIITFENPPYIEAEIDGMFKTKLGAITNLSINMDYQHQSYYGGGRPWLVYCTLEIIDLYSVIVWNNKRNQYAPNGLDIAETLLEHQKDPATPEIHTDLDFQFLTGQYASTGMGLLGQLFSKLLSPIAGALTTVGSAINKGINTITGGINQVLGGITGGIQSASDKLLGGGVAPVTGPVSKSTPGNWPVGKRGFPSTKM